MIGDGGEVQTGGVQRVAVEIPERSVAHAVGRERSVPVQVAAQDAVFLAREAHPVIANGAQIGSLVRVYGRGKFRPFDEFLDPYFAGGRFLWHARRKDCLPLRTRSLKVAVVGGPCRPKPAIGRRGQCHARIVCTGGLGERLVAVPSRAIQRE